MTAIAIKDVVVADRHRTDMGDIKALAESMSDVGQLQPIVITPQNRLVAGERRLVAARSLGWLDVEAHVVSNLTDAVGLLRAESDENTCRKPFAPTEAERIAAAREALLKPLAKERQGTRTDLKPSGKLPRSSSRPRDAAAKRIRHRFETVPSWTPFAEHTLWCDEVALFADEIPADIAAGCRFAARLLSAQEAQGGIGRYTFHPIGRDGRPVPDGVPVTVTVGGKK